MEDARIFSAMQTGEPLKRYEKTILAKVHLLILDPFSGKLQELILEGAPGSDTSYVEIWSAQEDMFIQKMNKHHFKEGRMKVMESFKAEVPSPNQITDTEIEELLDAKFMTLKNRLDKFTSSAPVYRLLEMAEAKPNVSAKIVSHIQNKLAEFDLDN